MATLYMLYLYGLQTAVTMVSLQLEKALIITPC